jgi:hypothetical protein
MATTSYINAPKQGSDESQKIPGRFFVEKMVMIFPSDPIGLDIRKIVTSFNITAEVFSPIVTFSGSIRDTDNIIGKRVSTGLTGQEIIELEIVSGYDNTQKKIKHRFVIKEYPNYIKTLDFPSNQIFTFVAVSEFAYTDRLMKISRAVKQDTYTNIKKIFVDDLGLQEVKLEGNDKPPISKFDGVITIQSPLSAAEWLRSRSFDEDQSPFFLYNKVTDSGNLKGSVYFASFDGLVKSQKNLRVPLYEYRQSIKDEPGTLKAYTAEQTRILSMKSNLKLDRLKTALEGGYANRLNVTDFAAKTYYTLDYTTAPSTFWKSNQYRVDGSLAPGKILNNIPEASISGVQVNFAPTYGDPSTALTNSVTSSLAQNIQRTKSFIARMNEYDHEIIVYGNTYLNPGVAITLKIPAVPTDLNEQNIDYTVSGFYLISVASHNFVDGVYTCKLKLFRVEDLPITENSQPVEQTPLPSTGQPLG